MGFRGVLHEYVHVAIFDGGCRPGYLVQHVRAPGDSASFRCRGGQAASTGGCLEWGIVEMAHGSTGIGESTPRSRFHDRGRFGRLFGGLPPFAADTPLIREALAEIGAPGGPMDALDDLADPVTLITDPAKSAHNANNPTMTAGFTFLGQFLDHDMTFDPTSSLPSSRGEFHPPALTDPYVNLSVHTALVVLVTRLWGRSWSRPNGRSTVVVL